LLLFKILNKAMEIYSENLLITTDIGIDIKNITYELEDILNSSGIKRGILTAFVLGSTGSITTIEFEPGVVQDLKRIINSIAPKGDFYEHERAWHDGNGHSHVQAALLGPSITIPVSNGEMQLGTWQQVVLINHDIRARKRKVSVTIIGSS